MHEQRNIANLFYKYSKMWNYKIAYYPKVNERAIFREDWETRQRFTPQRLWSKNEKRASRYLHEQDCTSDLAIIKFSKWLKTEEEYIEEKRNEWKIKQSWGELSSS